MADSPRLTGLGDIPARVRLPGYAPGEHEVGIVHIGVGAFHRAHQAVYTDDVLAASGGNWRIQGISLRGSATVRALQEQQGFYTVLTRGSEGTSARIIGSLAGVIDASHDAGAAMAALVRPETRIVSLTVTEKAYGLERASGKVLITHPAIAQDLSHPAAPTGVIGVLFRALQQRRAAGLAPFTVLCCDNLPDNGALLRAGIIDFARRIDPALAEWIALQVAFPSSMVDRITPAPTAATLDDAREATGHEDRAAVETEAFSQWVLEDRFTCGRPDWAAAGVLLVRQVAPYEHMKLRMLNGAHSLIAYLGHVAGERYVRDVMRRQAMAHAVRAHLLAAMQTLSPLDGIDLAEYAEDLMQRFANPAIAHETYQIAMDGTEKLPQRLFAPALDALDSGGDGQAYALAVAAWMRYCMAKTDDGVFYALRDPREPELAACVARHRDNPESIVDALFDLPDLFPARLQHASAWRHRVSHCFTLMLEQGMSEALNICRAMPRWPESRAGA